MGIRPIKINADHDAALREIERLWGAPEESQERDGREVLATLVETYERTRFPVGVPHPMGAIQFRLEQQATDTKARTESFIHPAFHVPVPASSGYAPQLCFRYPAVL
jgi:HTH-type transcriptional regulator/antitoxin HigA